MAVFVLTIAVDTEGAPAPTEAVVQFGLPPGGTDNDARTIARGIRRAFRDAFSERVRVVSFQEHGLSRDVDLNPPPA